MTIEEALEYCTKERVNVEFFTGHVEVYDGWYTTSEVEFVDAVAALKELNEQ